MTSGNQASAGASGAPRPRRHLHGPGLHRARRTVVGVVSSDRMDKTVKVTVTRDYKHPKYEKRIRRSAVYAAHDEKNEARAGDTVRIAECRRLSKTKTWRLVAVLQKSV